MALAPLATVTPNQSAIFTALRSILLAALPAGMPIIQGQANRIAEPGAADFALMTPAMRTRLATNIDHSVDGFASNTESSTTSLQKTQVTIQIDVHGPNGSDNAQIATTMLRSFFTAGLIAASGVQGVSVLYAEDPRQVPFANGEGQYEFRWSINAVLQADQTVTTTIPAINPGFAASLNPTSQPI